MATLPSRLWIIALVSATALPLGARSEADLPRTDPDDALDVEAAPAPCLSRYRLAARPQPATGKPVLEAVTEAFDTSRYWGIEENLSLRPPRDALGPSIEVRFPRGSINPGNRGAPLGGAGFYSGSGMSGSDAAACLAYRVFFPDGFDFARGGKLPGLHGGHGPSGGEEVDGDDGFSVRFMWREDGQGELYEYIVNAETDFGLSVGRGSWTFPTGRWVELQLEVILNTPGRADGVARAWVDRRPVVDQTDIVYRTVDDVHVAGLMFSTFFGGNDPSWASPKDQRIWFADFRTLVPAGRGRTAGITP